MKDSLKILFATDFSAPSKMALRTLSTLQKKFTLDVSFIHVITSYWKDWLASGLYEKEAKQRLQIWQTKLTHNDYDDEKLYVVKGNSANAILSKAQELDVDVIFLGGELLDVSGKRHSTSYTTEGVVRGAKNSIWLCQTHQIKRILCGIDGSWPSEKSLNEALDLAKRFSAQLTVVHVLPHIQMAIGMEKKDIEVAEKQMKSENIEKMKAFLKRFDFKKIKVDYLYPWGIPSKVMLDIAEDFDIDLVVIGARGHSKISQVLIGSTASRILRYAKCSLLVVH